MNAEANTPQSLPFGYPVAGRAMIRRWAAASIRHDLYCGRKALTIASEIEASGIFRIGATPERVVVVAMLGVEGAGPTIDAALRHWCEIVEGGE